MIYDLTNQLDYNKAVTFFKRLLDKKTTVEVKEVKNTRTVSQNAYMHVCISLFAIEFGYTLEEAKTMLKRQCSFMVYEKKDQRFLKRTRDMDSDEIGEFIDWIRTYAGKAGLYIPSSEEYLKHKISVDKDISRHKEYL